MGKRRLAREYCLQILYLADTAGFSLDDAILALNSYGNPLEPATLKFARSLAGGVISNCKKYDKIIQDYAHNWQIQRMASVDRCVLRLASHEILIMPETPLNVIIDEAIELAKKFSTQDSGRFINGVLDRLKAERDKPEA